MSKKQAPARAKIAGTVTSSYRKGASIRTIARKTGKSYGTVHNILSASGTKFRSRGGPNHHGKH